jgi:hypothetical protein
MWVIFHEIVSPIPKVGDEVVEAYEGELVAAREPARGTRYIEISSPEITRFRPASYENWDLISDALGKKVRVLAFRNLSIFLLPELIYIDIEVDGNNLVNWEEERLDLERNKTSSKETLLWLMAISLMTMFIIFRINRKGCE